jgi:hypothetical protein
VDLAHQYCKYLNGQLYTDYYGLIFTAKTGPKDILVGGRLFELRELILKKAGNQRRIARAYKVGFEYRPSIPVRFYGHHRCQL